LNFKKLLLFVSSTLGKGLKGRIGKQGKVSFGKLLLGVVGLGGVGERKVFHFFLIGEL